MDTIQQLYKKYLSTACTNEIKISQKNIFFTHKLVYIDLTLKGIVPGD